MFAHGPTVERGRCPGCKSQNRRASFGVDRTEVAADRSPVSAQPASYFTPALAAASGSIFFKAMGTAAMISFELRSANNFTSTGTAALRSEEHTSELQS